MQLLQQQQQQQQQFIGIPTIWIANYSQLQMNL